LQRCVCKEDTYHGTTFSRAVQARGSCDSLLPQAGAEPKGEATKQTEKAKLVQL